MSIQTTYSNARSNFAELLDQVTHNNEVVVINRRGEDAVAMIAMSELQGLAETAHLLRSPKNAKRLLKALARARSRSVKPRTLEAISKRFGLE